MKLKTRIVGFGTLAVLVGTYLVAFHVIGTPLSQSVDIPVAPASDQIVEHRHIKPIHPLEMTKDISSHLNVIRKDLGINNFTSDHSSTNGRMAVSFANMSDAQLMDYLKSSDLFNNTDSASSIIRMAHILEKIQQKMGSPKVLNQEFVPDFLQDDKPFRQREPEPANFELPVKSKRLKLSFPRPYWHSDPLLMGGTNLPDVTLSPRELSNLHEIVEKMSETHRKRRRRRGPTLDVYTPSKSSPAWERFHNQISQFHMYSEEDGVVDDLLREMATLPIVHMAPKSGGTQLKLTFTFANNGKALWKPMRFPREQETLPDHFYFVDFERHNAEIAAFHLDRVLGFRRVVPVAGRTINITQDVLEYANYDLARTVFFSPAGRLCFHGVCDYYCDSGHPVCGNPDVIEGSFAAYLPSQSLVKRKVWRNPWRRSYHKRRQADWQMQSLYCRYVKRAPPYSSGRRLLDLIDLAAFDFLTGNMDRHHYETFEEFGNFSFIVVLDNGRAFGKAQHDQVDALAPIFQCCLFRYSTLLKLLQFDQGPRHLSDVMRDSLSRDKLNPILTEPHLMALDRRVKIILNIINRCVQKTNDYESVIIDDGF